MNENIENREVSLIEILVKTSYQVQVTHPDDKNLENPVAYGSGFIVVYEDKHFFVTADHVLHIDDYKGVNAKRTWKDYIIAIFNNIQPKDNFLSTLITPLGGFYYMEQFNLKRPDQMNEPVDITLCMMKPINLQNPFLTDEVNFIRETIKAGEQKWNVTEDCFAKPNADTNYFIYGKIKTKIEGIQLKSEPTLKENLKFVKQIGDYYLFNTEVVIEDKEDWEGLSGSAIISLDGDCIGVVCSINENTKSVWVMPIDKVRMLIEVAIIQEKLEI